MSSRQSPLTLLSSCHSRYNSSFLRDYAATQINVFLWISLIVVTLLLLRKLIRLLALWAKGSRISGPPCPSFYGHSKLISETNLTGEAHFVLVIWFCRENVGKVVAHRLCELWFFCSVSTVSYLLRALFDWWDNTRKRKYNNWGQEKGRKILGFFVMWFDFSLFPELVRSS